MICYPKKSYKDIVTNVISKKQYKLGALENLQKDYFNLTGRINNEIEEELTQVNKRYTSLIGKIQEKYSKFLALKDLSDLELRLASLNYRVNLDDEHIDVSKRDITENQYFSVIFKEDETQKCNQEKYEYKEHSRLESLAREYILTITSETPGTFTIKNKELIDLRTKEQKEIASLIIEESYKKIKKIAYQIFNHSIRMPKGKVFYKPMYTPIKEAELIGIGTLEVLKEIHNYKPEKGNISTFIRFNTASAMNRSMKYSMGLLSLSENNFRRFKGIVARDEKKKAILNITEILKEGRFKEENNLPASMVASNIYAGFKPFRGSIELHTINDFKYCGDDTYTKYENEEVQENLLNSETPEDLVARNYLQKLCHEIIDNINFKPKEKIVLEEILKTGIDIDSKKLAKKLDSSLSKPYALKYAIMKKIKEYAYRKGFKNSEFVD